MVTIVAVIAIASIITLEIAWGALQYFGLLESD